LRPLYTFAASFLTAAMVIALISDLITLALLLFNIFSNLCKQMILIDVYRGWHGVIPLALKIN